MAGHPRAAKAGEGDPRRQTVTGETENRSNAYPTLGARSSIAPRTTINPFFAGFILVDVVLAIAPVATLV